MTDRHLDFDAIRAARGERLGERPTVTVYGETYELPAEMPFAIVEAYALDDAPSFHRAALALFGAEALARITAAGATADELADLLGRIGTLYGVADPEVSGASPAP